MRSWLTPLVLIPLASLLAQTPGARIYPIDETARDPSFQAYTAKLRRAVVSRDSRALRRLIDEEAIVAGPGKKDQGWPSFVARWRPEDPESEVWSALADLLALGFLREQPGLFLSPYNVWRFPAHLDRRTHLVVARDRVALRESPSPSAPSRGMLSFDVVHCLGEPVRSQRLGAFVPVETLDGRKGYVSATDLLSPTMPRAQFALRRKRWVLIALESD